MHNPTGLRQTNTDFTRLFYPRLTVSKCAENGFYKTLRRPEKAQIGLKTGSVLHFLDNCFAFWAKTSVPKIHSPLSETGLEGGGLSADRDRRNALHFTPIAAPA